MAAAMVSATAARMLDKDGSLSPDTIKARLMRSARKIDGNPTVVGAGVLIENSGYLWSDALQDADPLFYTLNQTLMLDDD